MAQGKGQMVGQLVAGLVALVEDAKTPFLALAASNMFLRNTAWLPDGCLDTERLDERREACKLCPFGNKLLLEAAWRFQIKAHESKIYCPRRKLLEI